MKDVLIFKYLPILWYKYPIPNEIREFWYTQRPDILNYMQQAYKNIDIQFLPDRIINEAGGLGNSIKQLSTTSYLLDQNSLEVLLNSFYSPIETIISNFTF